MEVPKVRRRSAAGPGMPRRVMTAPSALQRPRLSTRPSSDELVETLYNHPNARIVSFTSSARSISHGGPDIFSSADDNEPGTLSWSSQLERTIAVGPFRIYRAPGSVAFLSSGSVLQPILPKSQCWCIDEDDSMFVLQIRRPTYWRIELPVTTPYDKERTVALRHVLDQVLQFEKTECPFKRSFYVELPERPQGPIKKIPWRRVTPPIPDDAPGSGVEGKKSTLPTGPSFGSNDDITKTQDGPNSSSAVTPNDITLEPGLKTGYAIDYTVETAPLAGAIPVSDHVESINSKTMVSESVAASAPAGSPSCPENAPQPTGQRPSFPAKESLPLEEVHLTTDKTSSAASKVPVTWQSDPQGPSMGALVDDSGDMDIHVKGTPPVADVRLAENGSCDYDICASAPELASATISTPAEQFLLQLQTPPSSPRGEPSALHEPVSPAGSQDSFHSVQSQHSDSSHLSRFSCNRKLHSSTTLASGESENQGTHTSTNSLSRSSSTRRIPGSFVFDDDEDEALSAAIDTLRPHLHQQTPSGTSGRDGRVTPSLQPASALFASVPLSERSRLIRNGMQTVTKLPMTILVKTCELLLGPPAHLLALMLKVAARISAGDRKGQVYGYDEHGDQIPVHWDYSEGDFSDWTDDDETHDSRSQGSQKTHQRRRSSLGNRNQKPNT